MGDPREYGYSSHSGAPWVASKTWFDALSGGKLNMRMIREPATAVRLPTLRDTELWRDSMALRGDPLNPSVVVMGDELIVNVRVCNKAAKTSENFLGTINLETGDLTGRYLTNESSLKGMAYGFEDLRLFDWNGGLHAIAAVSMPSTAGAARTWQAVLKIDGAVITHAWEQPSKRHEKNWMPCVSEGRLRLVYATDPLIVLEWINGAVAPSAENLPELDGIIRGSSQLIPYGDNEWLAVVHQIHVAPGATLAKAVYVHRFAVFDHDLRRVRLSTPFYFQHNGIEFCAGLAYWRGRYVLTAGVRDVEAWLYEVSPETVDAFVSGAIAVPMMPLDGTIAAGPPNASPTNTATYPTVAPYAVVGQPSGPPSGAWNPLLGGHPPQDPGAPQAQAAPVLAPVATLPVGMPSIPHDPAKVGGFNHALGGWAPLSVVQAATPSPEPLDATPPVAIELEREVDGRWIAEIPKLPGVMVYGEAVDEALEKVESLARDVAESLPAQAVPVDDLVTSMASDLEQALGALDASLIEAPVVEELVELVKVSPADCAPASEPVMRSCDAPRPLGPVARAPKAKPPVGSPPAGTFNPLLDGWAPKK